MLWFHKINSAHVKCCSTCTWIKLWLRVKFMYHSSMESIIISLRHPTVKVRRTYSVRARQGHWGNIISYFMLYCIFESFLSSFVANTFVFVWVGECMCICLYVFIVAQFWTQWVCFLSYNDFKWLIILGFVCNCSAVWESKPACISVRFVVSNVQVSQLTVFRTVGLSEPYPSLVRCFCFIVVYHHCKYSDFSPCMYVLLIYVHHMCNFGTVCQMPNICSSKHSNQDWVLTCCWSLNFNTKLILLLRIFVLIFTSTFYILCWHLKSHLFPKMWKNNVPSFYLHPSL